MLEQVTVTRYATPLREGGSLPAIVEADNLGTYVMEVQEYGHRPGWWITVEALAGR